MCLMNDPKGAGARREVEAGKKLNTFARSRGPSSFSAASSRCSGLLHTRFGSSPRPEFGLLLASLWAQHRAAFSGLRCPTGGESVPVQPSAFVSKVIFPQI